MNILIVDDEADIRNLIRGILEDEAFTVRCAQNSDEAYNALEEELPDALILDIWLQGSKADGLEILKTAKAKYPNLPVIMISGHGTVETAVAAIRDGAYDFIEKPFKSDRLILMLNRAIENASLKRENAALKKQTASNYQDLIGESSAIMQIKQLMERVSPTNSRVLICGEAGTGKDVVARCIHKHSTRSDEAFVVVNCATLTPEYFEMELFGTSRSGSVDERGKSGLLEQAHRGTLFLDEISDMPLQTQGKIVRVLQENRFQRVGDDHKYDVDVRVLASTNRNLDVLIKQGKFREDLFYRLNVVPVLLPALRDRVQDIPLFADYFLGLTLKKFGLPHRGFSKSALDALKLYAWPGNVRQLKNTIEWMVIMFASQVEDTFETQHLPSEVSGRESNTNMISLSSQSFNDEYLDLSLRDAREVFERQYLMSQVSKFDGNISKTAQFVGMERSALHRKLKSLQINLDKEVVSEIDSDNIDSSEKRRA